MPFTDPFAASPEQPPAPSTSNGGFIDPFAQSPAPNPASGGFIDPFAQSPASAPSSPSAPSQPVSSPSRSAGPLGPILNAGKWALGEAGSGAKDLLRGLRVPQQVTATALADFLVTHHRLPSVSEWLQTASKAVGSDESFDTVLQKAGLPNTLARHIEGLILDVVADPLWLVTPAKIAEAARIPKLIEAFKATEGAKALMEAPHFAPVRKAIRFVASPDFGLPKKFVQHEMDYRVGVNRAYQEAIGPSGLATRINVLKPEEQQLISRYMEEGAPWQYGQAITGQALTQTPEQARVLAEAAAKGLNVDAIRQLGEEARTADLNQLRDLISTGTIPKAVVDPFHKLPGEYILGIGPDLERERAMRELFRNNPSEYFRGMAKLSKEGLPLPSSHFRREYRFWEDPQAYIKKLSQMNPEKRAKELTDEAARVATSDPEKAKRLLALSAKVKASNPAEEAAKLEAWWRTRAGMSQSGSFRPFALNFGFLQSRDATIDEVARDAMGEIREAAHPIATSMIEGQRFVELHRFLKKVADDFASPQFKPGWTYIENKNLWGPLKNMWVPPDIGDMILRTVGKDNTGPARLLRMFRMAVGKWKYGKIVLSPGSHARIILHNFLLWDWSGSGGILKTQRLMQAMRALARQDADPLYREMMSSGVVLHNTFAERTVDDLLTRDPALIEDADTWQTVSKNLEKGSHNIFRTWVGKPAEQLMAYEERLFKAATFAEYRAQGKAIPEAAQLTNSALLNYKKMPEFWNLIRGYGIVPFIAFPLQATTRVARALAERPAVIGKYGKIFRDVETSRSGLTPNQIRAEKSVLPPEMDKGVGWLRLGRNPDGTVRYLNLSYVLPLWILPQTFASLQAMTPNGVRSQPWTSSMAQGMLNVSAYPLAKALIEGVDPYTGKPFQSVHDMLMYLYNFAAPPLTGIYAQELWQAAHGRPMNQLSKGAPKKVPDVLERAFLAWNTRDLDPQMEQIWRMRELQKDIRDVDKDIQKVATAPYITPEQRDHLLSQDIDRIRAIVSALSVVAGTKLPDSTLPAAAAFPQPASQGGFQNPFQTP